MFWKTWSTSVNGAWPIHWVPSPPIWVRPSTWLSGRSDTVTIVWQPMPPPPSEPSGSTVERLCGQPEQKYGVRCGDGEREVRAGRRRPRRERDAVAEHAAERAVEAVGGHLAVGGDEQPAVAAALADDGRGARWRRRARP